MRYHPGNETLALDGVGRCPSLASLARPLSVVNSLTPPALSERVCFPSVIAPMLAVILDVEEEFDWRTFSSNATSVKTVQALHSIQPIFDKYGIKPTFAIDYPVASQPDGYLPLLELYQSGLCDIGTQLHPWVSPPFDEVVCARNSYPGNLPPALEKAKLSVLTEKIGEVFGLQSRLYRAGRYGFGTNTARILQHLGYEIDCSVRPHINLSYHHGPDYQNFDTMPFWMQDGHLLELPVTVGMTGLLEKSGMAHRVLPWSTHPRAERFRVPAVLSRLQLLNRAPLSPEGTTITEAKQVTRAMLRNGQRYFAVSFHSPSLVPGHTPYVRTSQDLDRFVHWLDEYFAFFLQELGGWAVSPPQVLDLARTLRDQPDQV